MISLYRPGSSVLHRMAAGTKLLALAVLALAVTLYPHSPVSIAVVAVVVVSVCALSRLPVRVLLTQVWQLRYVLLTLGILLALFDSPLTAAITTARVVGIVILASVVTLTTRMSELMEVLHTALRPLARFGVNAEAVALTLSLTLAMVPVVAAHAERLREAEQARDVRIGLRATVPLMVMALRHADDVGDALAARGLA